MFQKALIISLLSSILLLISGCNNDEFSQPNTEAPQTAEADFTATEDQVLNGRLEGNDRDGDTLLFSLQEAPKNGSLVLYPDGTFTYVPNENFHGEDHFTYRLSDGYKEVTDSATITVTAANDLPQTDIPSFTVLEDIPLSGQLHATDIDGDVLRYETASDPQNGTLVLNPDGTFVYTPHPDYFGPDGFSFRVHDLSGYVEAEASITVQGTNDAPLATSESFAMTEDTPYSGTLSGIDAESTALTFIKVADPGNGTMTLNADGSFSYTPHVDYFGNDSFVYKVSDGELTSAEKTVTLIVHAVNDMPLATSGSFSLAEDSSYTGKLSGTDTENTPLIFSKVSDPANGLLNVAADGTFTYTPATDYFGPDSFMYQVSDGLLSSPPKTVLLNVSAVNDTPHATTSLTFAMDEDASYTGILNGTDTEGSPLVFIKVSDPAHGSISLSANGSFTYTPAIDYYGSDSFVYKVSDGELESTGTTVSFLVNSINDAPTATSDSFSITEDTPYFGTLGGLDTENDPLSFSKTSNPLNGTLTINENGNFSYIPDADYYGSDSFTYKVSDGALDSSIKTVNLTVANTNDDFELMPLPEKRYFEHLVSINVSAVRSIEIADFDGDGKQDIVSASYGGNKVEWYKNQNAYFSPSLIQSVIKPTAVTVADINGDGTPDVLIATENTNRMSWHKNINSSFSLLNTIDPAPQIDSVKTADINGDGYLDTLRVSWQSGVLAWYSRNISVPRYIISTAERGAHSLDAADMDGDGDIDVLVASSDYSRITWYENANTVFTRRIISTNNPGVNSIVAADMDGDGDKDILIASKNDHTIAWYKNTNTTFTKQIITTTALGAYAVTAADVDGDGDLDAVAASYNNDTVAWYENNNGTFTQHIVTNQARGASSVKTADMDNDGDLDIISASTLDNTIAWYEFNRPVTTTTDRIYTFGVTDPDGDVSFELLPSNDSDLMTISGDGELSFITPPTEHNFYRAHVRIYDAFRSETVELLVETNP